LTDSTYQDNEFTPHLKDGASPQGLSLALLKPRPSEGLGKPYQLRLFLKLFNTGFIPPLGEAGFN